MILLEIPELTPSLNEIKREYRNVHVYRREQEKWDWLVAQATKQKDKGANLARCKMSISRCGPRKLDRDNYHAGLKFLMDALVHNNLIADDSNAVIVDFAADQIKTPKKEAKMVVKIDPVE